MSDQRINLGGFSIQLTECYADVLVPPFGHFVADPQEKVLRPLHSTSFKLIDNIYKNPVATVEILDRVERVVQIIYPNAAPDVGWFWELPDRPSCPNCCC